MPVQALYANISLLEHSCINNASKHFDGDFRQGSEELIYNIYEGLKGFWSNFQHYFYFYFFPIFLEDFLLLWGGLWTTMFTVFTEVVWIQYIIFGTGFWNVLSFGSGSEPLLKTLKKYTKILGCEKSSELGQLVSSLFSFF